MLRVRLLTTGVSAVAFGDLGEFDSRSACCLRGVRRYGVLGSGCWHSFSSVCAGFATVCTGVVQIAQRLHPNGNSRKLKRTGVFTALSATTLLFPGAKRALISRKRRKILFLEIKVPLVEKGCGRTKYNAQDIEYAGLRAGRG